jgi:hypothetical protein
VNRKFKECLLTITLIQTSIHIVHTLSVQEEWQNPVDKKFFWYGGMKCVFLVEMPTDRPPASYWRTWTALKGHISRFTWVPFINRYECMYIL